MGRILAAVYDAVVAPAEHAGLATWRADLLAGLSGTVVEVGAGTGANLAYYPATVDRLVLVEPDRPMRRRLERAVARRARARAVHVLDATAQSLPLPEGSAHAVVATLVLCTVPDPRAALAEARRVLRPDGTFVFIEHVAAPDPNRRRWQRRLDPLWRRVAGGCRLTRDTAATIRAAGFSIDHLVAEALPAAPPVLQPSVRGRAQPSSP